jgi:hypothetical protein
VFDGEISLQEGKKYVIPGKPVLPASAAAVSCVVHDACRESLEARCSIEPATSCCAGACAQACADLITCRVHCPAEAPHGVFPMGQLIATSLADMCWPGHPIYALSADAVFKVPVWRHVMTW